MKKNFYILFIKNFLDIIEFWLKKGSQRELFFFYFFDKKIKLEIIKSKKSKKKSKIDKKNCIFAIIF